MSLFFKNLITHILSFDLYRLYNVGFLLGIFFFLQVLSGIFLSLNFNLIDSFAYFSALNLLDCEILFLTRSTHILGTSLIYFFLYLHFFKILINELLLNISILVFIFGILILYLSIGIAFLGYVLPLSQMSYWGLVVFSNIISCVPFLGKLMCFWLWGGEFISGETISKIHVIHIMLPFLSLGLIFLHLYILHINISSDGYFDRFTFNYESTFFMCISFYKDFFLLYFILNLWSFFFFIWWTFVFHEESFEIMNVQKTSSKIIPEWFFLIFFGFIKAVPSKLGGLFYMIFMLLSTLFLFSFMFYDFSFCFKFFKYFFNFIFFISFFIIAHLASVVLLLHPLIEFLFLMNIFLVSYTYFKFL